MLGQGWLSGSAGRGGKSEPLDVSFYRQWIKNCLIVLNASTVVGDAPVMVL